MPPHEKMDMIQQAALGQHGFIVFAQAKTIDIHCSDNSFWNGIVHRPNPCRASLFSFQTREVHICKYQEWCLWSINVFRSLETEDASMNVCEKPLPVAYQVMRNDADIAKVAEVFL